MTEVKAIPTDNKNFTKLIEATKAINEDIIKFRNAYEKRREKRALLGENKTPISKTITPEQMQVALKYEKNYVKKMKASLYFHNAWRIDNRLTKYNVFPEYTNDQVTE